MIKTITFRNGVYDLTTRSFEAGALEQPCAISYDYPAKPDPDVSKQLLGFLTRACSDPRVLNRLLMFLCLHMCTTRAGFNGILCGRSAAKDSVMELISLSMEGFSDNVLQHLKLQDDPPEQTSEVYTQTLVFPFAQDEQGVARDTLMSWRGEFLRLLFEAV